MDENSPKLVTLAGTQKKRLVFLTLYRFNSDFLPTRLFHRSQKMNCFHLLIILHQFWRFTRSTIAAATGLPDGLFSNKKSKFG
jgi:hypothetical protein